MIKTIVTEVLTEDHYLPGQKKDFISFFKERINNTPYYLMEDQDLYNFCHEGTDLPLYQLDIQEHNDDVFLLRILDPNKIITTMTALKNKPFLQKIVDSTKFLWSLFQNYKTFYRRNSTNTVVTLDLQQSGYQLTSEEVTVIGNICAKMAAKSAIDYKKLTNVNFKLSFQGDKKDD